MSEAVDGGGAQELRHRGHQPGHPRERADGWLLRSEGRLLRTEGRLFRETGD